MVSIKQRNKVMSEVKKVPTNQVISKPEKIAATEEQLMQARLELVNKSIDDKDLPKFYSNGFTFAAGNSDIVLTFQKNNKPEAVFNLSMTIAKTLAKKLNDFFNDFESKSQNKIMTTDEIEKILTRTSNE